MNKQGSLGAVDPETGELLSKSEAEFHQTCRDVYEERLTKGIAREQARKDLPLGTYTEAYWKIDLHNLLHFLALRMDSHAQYEIRQYASIIGQEIVSKWVPITWEAFNDYRNNSMSLSHQEVRLISILIKGDQDKTLAEAKEMGWLLEKDGVWKPGREAKEIIPKLEQLGLISPW